jgi:hypothetical protein
MWALGDKIASNFVAQTAEVPTLPWSGSGEFSACLPSKLFHTYKPFWSQYIVSRDLANVLYVNMFVVYIVTFLLDVEK